MKKTLILYTGGTLGMRRSASGYVPDAHLESALQRLLEDTVDQLPQVDFQTLEPLLDSADMQPQDWYRIAAEIRDNYNHYTGFVVLHGTDTMAYTASALSFALQGLDKPVLVTGSQIPLREMRSDAYNNLIAALLLSKSEDIKEVCLYFSGKLLRGNRAVKVSSGSLDAFASPNYPSLGEVGIQVSVDPNVLLDPVNSPQFQTPESADGKVVLVKLFPGISPLFLSKLVEYRPRGLVIETYGTGNAPTNNTAFTAQLKTAAEAGIICVAVSQCLENQVDLGKYATGSALLRSGVVSGLDMTSIACFAKLNHLLAMRYRADEIKVLMGTSLCGECTPLYR